MPVAMMTRMHAGFTGVVQDSWPRPRGWAPPHRLDLLDVNTLPGVGPTLAKRLRGKLGRYGFDVKSYDIGETRKTADFAPVYPASEQIPSARLRELVRAALALYAGDLADPLPAELELPLRRDALAALHFPADES